MKANQDLNSQQEHLSSTSYDLRITNLARFIYKKVTNYELRRACRQAGITNSESVISSTFDKLSINSVERSLRVGRDDKVDNSKQLSFLDVGAGNGLFLKFFKAKGFKVAGFELEIQNVQNMKRDPVLIHENITKGDITKLTGKQEYDVVMASDVIEHIKDDVLAIKNLWSFVKKDGMMLITVPAHAHLFGKRDVMWGHHRRYDQDVLLDRIDQAICHSGLDPESRNKKTGSPIGVGDDKKYKIEFLTQWNIVGFYLYFLFEKILHKPINEDMRYSNSLLSRSVRTILDKILRLEDMIGGLPLGLTLIVGVRKTANN